jgi:hypothetical protein
VPDDGSVSMAEFNDLSDFIGDKFVACVSDQIDKIIETLQKARWSSP